MERVLVFDSLCNWMRAGVIEDGVLCELHSEKYAAEDPTESLYYGCVKQIRPALNAAFVDIGQKQNAFLPLEKDEQLRCGDYLIVQGAAKQTTDTKGLRITRKITLAGKTLVLIPGGDGVHISKKIRDEEQRSLLIQTAQDICPHGYGLIIRTASLDVTRQLLQDELETLLDQWNDALKKSAGLIRPGVIKAHARLDERLIRDLAGRELVRIVTNSCIQADQLREWQRIGMISAQTGIEIYTERGQLVFDAYGVETQLDKALRKRTWLENGGYLVIDHCEAMTVIDVNSGKMCLGKGIEETALKVNLEAADEIARQLRLRNIGGMITVDFIDMEDESHRKAVERRLKEAVLRDRVQVDVLGFTRLGLMEIKRRRERAELRKQMRISCSHCSGIGEVLCGEEIALRALQQVRRRVLSGQRGPFLISCSRAAAVALSAMSNPLSGERIYILAVSKHTEWVSVDQIGEDVPPPSGVFELRERMQE